MAVSDQHRRIRQDKGCTAEWQILYRKSSKFLLRMRWLQLKTSLEKWRKQKSQLSKQLDCLLSTNQLHTGLVVNWWKDSNSLLGRLCK